MPTNEKRWSFLEQGTTRGDTFLRQETAAHWELYPGEEQAIPKYAESLLADELKFAHERGQLMAHSCHTLVLLVGYSLEPLLQAIWVFEPHRVVLVCNKGYGVPGMAEWQTGRERAHEVTELIHRHLLPRMDLGHPVEITSKAVDDCPEAVFQILCEDVLQTREASGCDPARPILGEEVIIDITGAKKSMDAGAFLFAAYARTNISYVDFSEYDRKKKRPFGFSCHIGTLLNPYEEFQLREWQKIEELYRNGHFRAAAGLLTKVQQSLNRFFSRTSPVSPVPQMPDEHQGPNKFAQEVLSGIGILSQIMAFYEAWDDGDYHRCWNRLPDLLHKVPQFHPSCAATTLGKAGWPHTEEVDAERAANDLLEKHAEFTEKMLLSNELLLTYAEDEMAKIQRLVRNNEDNRSALLRATGIEELLLKARLVRLWKAGSLDIKDPETKRKTNCLRLDITLQRRLYDQLLKHAGIESMFNGLRIPCKYVPLKQGTVMYRAYLIPDVPMLADYWRQTEQPISLGPETMVKLRNEAIHKHMYVDQKLAMEALCIASANLANFWNAEWTDGWGQIPTITKKDIEQADWEEVCSLCGLSQFLPLAIAKKEVPDDPMDIGCRS